jgi:HEAT repeat protein
VPDSGRAGGAGEDPAIARAAALVALGLDRTADEQRVEAAAAPAMRDDDPRVRAAAVGALVRAGSADGATHAWRAALGDVSATVRRRAAELAPALATRLSGEEVAGSLVDALSDDDATVIEATAWALGELGDAAIAARATPALADTALHHDEPLAREAAVAALGALGDQAGLDAILHACTDKPAIRRRAVLALAPFGGNAVDAALAAALEDRDWQVRQAAEDLADAAERDNE